MEGDVEAAVKAFSESLALSRRYNFAAGIAESTRSLAEMEAVANAKGKEEKRIAQ